MTASQKIKRYYRQLLKEKGPKNKPKKTFENPFVKGQIIDNTVGVPVKLLNELLKEKSIERKYDLEQIKKAFWEKFHAKGELWFDYLGSEKDQRECTESFWDDFEYTLKIIQKEKN